MDRFLAAVTGLCAGIVSGTALCAFYIALGVFSKSMQTLGVKNAGAVIAASSAAGGILGTLITIFDVRILTDVFGAAAFGLFGGVYVGFVIACLAEITDVIPVVKNYGLSKRIIVVLLFGFVVGKTAGSLAYWLSGVF